MAIGTVVGFGNTAGTASNTSLSCTLPTITADGVAYLLIGSNVLATLTTQPSGWTLVDGPRDNGANTQRAWLYSKAVTSADSGASVTATTSSSSRWSMGGFVVPGGDGLGAVQYWADDTVDSTLSVDAITPTVDDAYRAILVQPRSNSAAYTVAPPAGWTELFEGIAGTAARWGVYAAGVQLSGQAGVLQAATSAAYVGAAARNIGYQFTVQPAGAVPATGSASGARTRSGTAAGARTASGTATGARTRFGTANGARAAAGAATGARARSGAAAGARAAAGIAAGAIVWSGAAAGAAAYQGSAAGERTRTGTAAGAALHQGSATGSRTRSGAAEGAAPGIGAATGSAAGSRSWSGAATGTTAYQGSATGARTRSGAAAGAAGHAGAAAGTRERTGTASGVTSRAGTAAGSRSRDGSALGFSPTVGGAQGSAAGSRTRSGAAVGAAQPLGAASGSRTRAGAATGRTAPAGTATGARSRSGVAAGVTRPLGTAAGGRTRAGTAMGAATALGSAAGARTRSGAAVGTSQTARDVVVLRFDERGRAVLFDDAPRPVTFSPAQRRVSYTYTEEMPMQLNPWARELYNPGPVTAPPVSGWEASFDEGATWHPSTVVDDRETWLVAGPSAEPGAAVAVITGHTQPLLRVAANPEVIVRRAPEITLYD